MPRSRSRVKVQCVCQNTDCGKVFFLWPSALRKGLGKYCCRPCADHARIQLIPRICAFCEKFFVIPPCRLKASECLYCSLPCAYAARTRPLAERFWAKIQRCDHEGLCIYCCWPWTGFITKAGYGHFSDKKESLPNGAHTIAWELWNKQKMPTGKESAHYCHTGLCCNPMHIHPATHLENIRESVRDHRNARGSTHGRRKFSYDDIQAIRQMAINAEHKDICKAFPHISSSHISGIVSHHFWKES
jgi:hypothetical protein